jgi:O-antigen ligase
VLTQNRNPPVATAPVFPVPAARPPQPDPIDRNWAMAVNNPVRTLGFRLCLFYVFLRFSFLHEILSSVFHINAYLILLVGTAAIMLTVFAGGVQRTLSNRAVLLWFCFFLWLLAATPFSSWRGGSLSMVMGYLKAQVPVPFIICGLALTWRECQKLMGALALAGVFNVMSGRLFADGEGRLNLEFGSIANANDYAAHLILILPFVLFVVLTKRYYKLIRFGALAVFVGGLFIAAGTGSRGFLIACGAGSIFAFLRGSGKLRVAMLVMVPVLLFGSAALLPRQTVARYLTLFGEEVNDNEVGGAESSKQARTHLFKQSLRITMEHPIFGVGPGEFTDYEGELAKQEGHRGAWQGTHNAYMEVSSEAGLPAFFFFVACMVAAFLSLNSVYRKAGKRLELGINPTLQELRTALFCVMLSLICFMVSIVFLTMAYLMYVPALVALSAVIVRAARMELLNQPGGASIVAPRMMGFASAR